MMKKDNDTTEVKHRGRPRKVLPEVPEKVTPPVSEETPKKRGGRPKKIVDPTPAAEETPKKKGGRSKKTSEPSSPAKKSPIRATWNDPSESVHLNFMHVEIKLTEGVLGTTPGDIESLKAYIASNAPDEKLRQEEIDQASEEEVEKKQSTIFPKGWFYPDGNKMVDVIFRQESRAETFDKEDLVKCPFAWNYQIRGYFKDSAAFLKRGKSKDGVITSHKKVIDGNIFVFPRRCAWISPDKMINDDGEIVFINPLNPPLNIRPLRTVVPGKGEFSSIASSEELPAGSILRFTVGYMDPAMRENIIAWLDYGCVHGFGAWRNSGKGTFIWREIKENYDPYTAEDLKELEQLQESNNTNDLSEAAEKLLDNISGAKAIFDPDEDEEDDD